MRCLVSWRSLASRPFGDVDLGAGRPRPARAAFDLLVPVEQRRSRDHDEDPGEADGELGPEPGRELDIDEVAAKRQELAEAEDLERMLAAQDDRPQQRRL